MIHNFSAPFDLSLGADVRLGGEAHSFVDFRTDAEREHPLLQQHDINSLDIAAVRRLAIEVVYTSGVEVEVYLRTDNMDYDRVYDEDPDPTYWAGVICKVTFVPSEIQTALKQWTLDTPINLEPVFALEDVINRFGDRLLRMGDVIRLPYGAIGNIRPVNFRVLNATPIGNFRYTWLYLKITMQSLTGDITVQPTAQSGTIVGDQQDE